MRRRWPSRISLVAFALIAHAATSGAAHAATPPTEAELNEARERFNAARKLEDAGRWAEALTLLQRVAEVKTTPQVRFHIALCMEKVGLWTRALDGFQQAAADKAAPPDVVQEANEHLHKLEIAIPTVSLVARGAAPGDELHLDERRLVIDESPLPIRTDPGPHTAEVRRDGAVVARQYFALAPKETLRLEVRVGNIAPERGNKPSDGRTQRAIGWTAVGVGAASVVLMGVFIGLRAGAMSRLESSCPTLRECPKSVADIVSEGKTDAALVNVFAVVGGVAGAAGVVLLLTAPRPRAAAATSTLSLHAAPGGLSLHGAF